MERIIAPLTDYDIFAYLMVGIAALAASDLVFGSRFLIRNSWDFGVATMVVIAAYVAGQIVAGPAEWTLERLLARQLLGDPVHHLVMSKVEYQRLATSAEGFDKACEARRKELDGILFGTVLSYVQPLPCADQQNIRKNDAAPEGAALFFQAYRAVKNRDHVRDRLSTFSRLYIFSRNMSFVAFLAAFAVAVQALRRRTENKPKPKTRKRPRSKISPWLFDPRWQFILFVGIGLGLLYRYLFFYRLYSIEVLTAYVGG